MNVSFEMEHPSKDLLRRGFVFFPDVGYARWQMLPADASASMMVIRRSLRHEEERRQVHLAALRRLSKDAFGAAIEGFFRWDHRRAAVQYVPSPSIANTLDAIKREKKRKSIAKTTSRWVCVVK